MAGVAVGRRALLEPARGWPAPELPPADPFVEDFPILQAGFNGVFGGVRNLVNKAPLPGRIQFLSNQLASYVLRPAWVPNHGGSGQNEEHN